MTVQYDSAIIMKFAGRLYAQAQAIVARYTLLGLVLGGLLGYVGGALNHTEVGGALVGFGFFGIVGYFIGQERAFHLKLQAQQALCFVQIEMNTRARRTAT